MSCDDPGLYTETPLRGLFVGDGRVWHLTFDTDVSGMVGRLIIKKMQTDLDDAALAVADGVLDDPAPVGDVQRIKDIVNNPGLTDAEKLVSVQTILVTPGAVEVRGMTFTLTDVNAANLVVGGAHIGVRVKPLNGVTTTIVNQRLRILPASPAVLED